MATDLWLSRSLNRVAHVPGVLRRRALMLGRDDDATRSHLQVPCASNVVSDATFLVHDAVATFRGSDRDIQLLKDAIRFHRKHAAKSAAYRAGTLADALVTAAALGDLVLLRTLVEECLKMVGAHVDFAALMQAVCTNGYRDVVAWLWTLPDNSALCIPNIPEETIREALKAGARRALDIQDETNRNDEMVRYIRTLLRANDADLTVMAEESTPTNGEALRAAKTAQLTAQASLPSAVAALRVLTSRSLISVIGGFQESLRVVVDPLIKAIKAEDHPLPPHAVARFAIIYGDLRIFQAACLVAKVRAPDLPLLLHFAVCEGRLDMVCWLHSQFVDDVKCRPDTMAMAVRCGWPEVVAWLHSHCPESAQTMSSDVWSDAARWGHVNVLRVSHMYDIAESSPGMILNAVGGGKLEVVRFLHLLDWGYDHNLAMHEAFKQGQSHILRWLYTVEAVSSGRLLEAFCSNAPTAASTVNYMWSQIYPADELVLRCVFKNFSLICEKASTPTIEKLLSLSVPDSCLVFEGLVAAIKAARLDNIKWLMHHGHRGPSHRMDALLLAAMDTGNAGLIKWFIRQRFVDSTNLDRLFARAIKRQAAFLNGRVDSLIKGVETDPSALCVMKAIDSRRQQERARAHPGSSLNDNVLAVERAILKNIPETMRPKLIAFYTKIGLPLEHGEADYTYYVTQVDGVVQLLTSEGGNEGGDDDAYHDDSDDDPNSDGYDGHQHADENEVEHVDDHELSSVEHAIRWARRIPNDVLQSPFCAVHAAGTGNLDMLAFLHARRLLPSFMVEVIVKVAHTHGQISVLGWVCSRGGTLASDPGIRLAMAYGYSEIVNTIIDLHDAGVDRTLQRVLLTKLREEVGTTNERARISRDGLWAISLLRLVMQKRPDQHQRLLETAAEAGCETAVEYILWSGLAFNADPVRLNEALVAAARGKNEKIVKMIYASKREGEHIEINALRKLCGLAGIRVAVTLLAMLSDLDAGVRRQLESEREKASAFLFRADTTARTRSSKPTSREKPRRIAQAQPPRPAKTPVQTRAQ